MAAMNKTRIGKAITTGKRTSNLPNTTGMSVLKAVVRKLTESTRSRRSPIRLRGGVSEDEQTIAVDHSNTR